MYLFKRFAPLILSMAVAHMATAQDGAPPKIGQPIKALIGVEYVGDIETPQLKCTEVMSAPIYENINEWEYGELICHGNKPVLILKKLIAHLNFQNLPRWRIVDAIAVPDYKLSYDSPKKLFRAEIGLCTLDGRELDKYFWMLLDFGRHKKAQYEEREKVVHAWGFDTTHEKIVPISTKRVRCLRDVDP